MSKSSAVIGAVSVAIALSSVGYGVYASRRSEARIAALEARLAEAERITKNDYFNRLAETAKKDKARRIEIVKRLFANRHNQQAIDKERQEASN